MSTLSKFLFTFLICLNIVLGYLLLSKNDISVSTEYQHTIDSLEMQIKELSILRDSIDVRIDTVNMIIEHVHTVYEKDYNTILNNDVTEDKLFFDSYINEYRLSCTDNL